MVGLDNLKIKDLCMKYRFLEQNLSAKELNKKSKKKFSDALMRLVLFVSDGSAKSSNIQRDKRNSNILKKILD